jgi:AcrR family transcriptional regulator
VGQEREEVRSAASALRDAAAAFSRALGETISVAGVAAGRELADELKAATRELNDAAIVMGFEIGGESRRSPKAEKTRADLLAAARTVIAQKGYEGASVGDIAAAAGYTKGALYANFGSKEELFLEVARGLLADDAALKDSQVTLDLREVFEPHPESDEQATRTLLALELYLYALRHAEARADMAPLLAAAQEGVAALVHRSVADDPTGEPTQDERDLGFALVAMHTLGALVGPLMPGPDGGTQTVRRLVARLLGDAPSPETGGQSTPAP